MYKYIDFLSFKLNFQNMYLIVTVLLCLYSFHLCEGIEINSLLHPDTGLTVTQLITSHGYPLEEHWVTTSDGYILALHRIPYGNGNENAANRPAVLLMHNLASSSAEFVNMGPSRSIAYLLADQGYDVWLANARGNTWSKNHTTLDTSAREFWQFSWNEIGIYDLPAEIDYILETIGQENIYYIGHGQGTTAFFVMASERPEYNEKIRVMVAFSPMAYMTDFLSPIFLIASQFYETIEVVLNLLGWYEVVPHIELVATLASAFCDDGHPYQDICADLFFYFDGFSFSQMNATMLPVILSNNPAGASARQYYHYAQGIISGEFRQYDFGSESNLDIYGQSVPPDYDISLITAPIALFYSSNDWMASTTAVERLAEQLSNVALQHLVSLSTFNHNDFLYGIDAKSLVYDYVIDIFSQY